MLECASSYESLHERDEMVFVGHRKYFSSNKLYTDLVHSQAARRGIANVNSVYDGGRGYALCTKLAQNKLALRYKSLCQLMHSDHVCIIYI